MPVTHLLRIFLLCLALSGLAAAPAFATAGSPQAVAADARGQLQQVSQQLQQIRRSVGDIESRETLGALSERALQAQRQADLAVRMLGPERESLEARIAQLGEPADGDREGSAVASQRKALAAQQLLLDDLIKQGNLLSVEARQLAEAIEKERVQRLGRQLSRRVASPLSPALWREVIDQVPADWRHFGVLLRQQHAALQTALARHGGWPLLLALGVALLLFFPLRLWLRRWGRRFAASGRAPAGRLRRTGLAVWLLLVGTLLPGLAMLVLVNGLKAIDAIAPRLVQVADAMVQATFFAAFIAALSACLLVPKRPSWRLLALDDLAASRMRKYAWMAAGLMWVTLVGQTLNRAARTSEITGVALDGLLALCYIALIMAMLLSLTRLYRRQQLADGQAAADTTAPAHRRGGWAVLVRVFGHLTVMAALLATLLGWINLAMFAAFGQAVEFTGGRVADIQAGSAVGIEGFAAMAVVMPADLGQGAAQGMTGVGDPGGTATILGDFPCQLDGLGAERDGVVGLRVVSREHHQTIGLDQIGHGLPVELGTAVCHHDVTAAYVLINGALIARALVRVMQDFVIFSADVGRFTHQ